MSNELTVFSSNDSFESAQRMAKAICSSSLVPKNYQGMQNIGNVLIALEIAQRINASPLMVFQNLYLVHGNPGWSSKFLIATFNQCGRFSAIRYEWQGEAGKKDRACRAWAVERDTDQRVEGPWIDWALIDAEGWAQKNGSKWNSMAEKMFCYRAAAWMIDTVAPELSMGLPPADQLQDAGVIDVTPQKTTLDSLKAASPRIESPHVTPGPPVDSNGEIWNQEIHATGRDEKPVFNQDGSFRARRFTQKHKDDTETTEAAHNGESALSFANIAEMINLAESASDIAAAMVFVTKLPEDQQVELNSIAHDKSKGFKQ